MRTQERRATHRLVGALAGLSLVAAACGSDGNDAADADPATTEMDMNDEVHTDPDMDMDDEADADESDIGDPMDEGFDADQDDADTDTDTDAGDDATVTTEPAPEPDDTDELRIVSLSPTATETLFALGAEDLLVAVDINSNFPEAALDLPNELDAFEPNVESIAEFEPDLVLIGGDFTGLADQLAELDIESLDLPPAASLDDAFAQIEQLGAATGSVGEAAELVGQMQGDIDAIVERVGDTGAGLSFYHEISADLFTADSTTFIGEIYSLLGLENIADADDTESFGFPQLNAEFVVEANPDLIFLPTGTFAFTTADEVAVRPGWDAIAAVQNGNVIETDDEIGGRWGPRVVDYLDSVAGAVENLEAGLVAEG